MANEQLVTENAKLVLLAWIRSGIWGCKFAAQCLESTPVSVCEDLVVLLILFDFAVYVLAV